jgi:hypothetical protein
MAAMRNLYLTFALNAILCAIQGMIWWSGSWLQTFKEECLEHTHTLKIKSAYLSAVKSSNFIRTVSAMCQPSNGKWSRTASLKVLIITNYACSSRYRLHDSELKGI